MNDTQQEENSQIKNFQNTSQIYKNNYTGHSQLPNYNTIHQSYKMPVLKSQAMTNIIDLNNYYQHKSFEFSDIEIKQAFDALDINQQQYITQEELSLFLEHFQIPATQEEINEMIRIADLGNTKKVKYKQFKQIMKGESLSPIGVAYPPTGEMLQQKISMQDEYNNTQFQNLALNQSYLLSKRQQNRTYTTKHNDFNTQNISQLYNDLEEDQIILQECFEIMQLDKQKFQQLFKKLKENQNVITSNLKDLQEFFGIKDKEKSKKVYNVFVNQQKEIEYNKILIFWIASQNYDNKNKAFLSFYVVDREDKGMIKFQDICKIISWLNFEKTTTRREKVLRKIWVKLKLNTEILVTLNLFKKILENFQKILFTQKNLNT